MADDVVALVDSSDAAYCGGVWVSDRYILTASHCLDSEEGALIRTHDGSHRIGWVEWIDRRRDLILLSVSNPGLHPFAVLSSGTYAGERLQILGHPLRKEWVTKYGKTFTHISYRSPRDAKKMRMLLIFADIQPGNSGGGAFDSDGKLVGICSMRSDLYGYFVALEEIRGFLSDAGLTE